MLKILLKEIRRFKLLDFDLVGNIVDRLLDIDFYFKQGKLQP